MEQISNLFSISPTKITSERSDIISQFVEAINHERIDTKYKPVTGRGIAMKLSHIKSNSDLYFFLNECRRYQKEKGSFGKCFFGSIKSK